MFARLVVIVAILAVAVAWGARRSDSAGREQVYVVQAGDTVWSIAASNYGGDTRGGRVAPRGSQPPGRLARPPGPEAPPAVTRPNSGGMDLDVVFLGTAGSMPTAERSPTAVLVRRGGERLLFDCAEGTQRQLLRSTLGLIDLREVFLTHYHADHYLGLPGMLKTFALRGRDVPITIYGPPGLVELFGSLKQDLRPAHLPVRPRGARPRGDARPRRLPPRHVPRASRRLVDRLRAR